MGTESESLVGKPGHNDQLRFAFHGMALVLRNQRYVARGEQCDTLGPRTGYAPTNLFAHFLRKKKGQKEHRMEN